MFKHVAFIAVGILLGACSETMDSNMASVDEDRLTFEISGYDSEKIHFIVLQKRDSTFQVKRKKGNGVIDFGDVVSKPLSITIIDSINALNMSFNAYTYYNAPIGRWNIINNTVQQVLLGSVKVKMNLQNGPFKQVYGQTYGIGTISVDIPAGTELFEWRSAFTETNENGKIDIWGYSIPEEGGTGYFGMFRDMDFIPNETTEFDLNLSKKFQSKEILLTQEFDDAHISFKDRQNDMVWPIYIPFWPSEVTDKLTVFYSDSLDAEYYELVFSSYDSTGRQYSYRPRLTEFPNVLEIPEATLIAEINSIDEAISFQFTGNLDAIFSYWKSTGSGNRISWQVINEPKPDENAVSLPYNYGDFLELLFSNAESVKITPVQITGGDYSNSDNYQMFLERQLKDAVMFSDPTVSIGQRLD